MPALKINKKIHFGHTHSETPSLTNYSNFNVGPKLFYAGPATGVPMTPTFRQILATDLGDRPSNTKFLRGDMTWVTIASGNGEINVGDISYDSLINIPTTFAPSAHNHDTLYYTKGEINTSLNSYVLTNTLKTINGQPLTGGGNMVISGSISDGDKGGITVTGNQWVINNATITIPMFAATGTKDNTTFLRGDGVFAVPGAPNGVNNGASSLWIDEVTLIGNSTQGEPVKVNTAVIATVEYVDSKSFGGAGITDGDKGDISVTSSGTVWTIDNGVDATKLADGSVSNAEFKHLSGVSSPIQTQLNEKAETTHVHDASEITTGVFVESVLPAFNFTQTGFAFLRNIPGFSPSGTKTLQVIDDEFIWV